MSYLDQYEEFPECYRKKAYELAWLIVPCDKIVVEKIIPEAVAYVLKSARRNDKRERRITFTPLQLFQIGLLRAGEQALQGIPLTRGRAWIRYIIHLASYTVPHSSFDVIVGFGSILSNGSTKACVTLYNHLDPYVGVGWHKAGGQRIPLDGERRFKTIQQQMHARFEKIFETCGQELDLQETLKYAGDKIHEILKHILLWETSHVPDTYAAYCTDCEDQQKLLGEARLADLERTRVHIGIDQEQCLECVKSWHSQLSDTFTKWRLPHLRSASSNVPDTNPSQDDPPPDDDPWRPPDMSHWDEIDTRIKKEILWKEHEERAKRKNAKKNRGQESVFEVVVDGTVKALLNWRERSTGKISLPASARYVEIRNKGSSATVANCHLMDPDDLPQKGWKSAVKLFSGEKVHFAFFPEPRSDDEETRISMRVKMKASPWQFLTGGAERMGEHWQLAELFKVPAFVTVILALVLVGVGSWTVSRYTMLRCNEPSGVCFSIVGQRDLLLVLSDLRGHSINKARVVWGDDFDPIPGTPIVPGAAIRHTYRFERPVPPEGVTTLVRTFMPSVNASSGASVGSARRLRIMPDRIILDPVDDPAEVLGTSLSQSQRDSVTMDELVEQGLLRQLQDAQGYIESYSPNSAKKAVEIYQEVLGKLSPQARELLRQYHGLLEAADQDTQRGNLDNAARKYQALFSSYLPAAP